MSKWQKISIVLAGLLVLSCIALAGVSALWLTGVGGGNLLAALGGKTPPATASPAPLVVPRPGPGNASLQLSGTFGTVSAINGSAVTVAGAKGNSQVLTLGPQTRVIVAGQPNASASDIHVGDKFLALGVNRGTNSLDPRAVIVAPASYNQSNLKVGTIQSASGQTLTLLARNVTTTIILGSNTQVYAQNLQAMPASAIPLGIGVAVIGQPNGDGSFAAQLILARTARRIPRSNLTPTPSP